MKISYKESVPKREDIGVSSYLLYIVILCIILFWVWLQKPRFFLLVMGIKTTFTFIFGVTEVLMTMILDQKGISSEILSFLQYMLLHYLSQLTVGL